MIRDVCIHLSNEQPLLADLYDVPTAADAGLLCTNVRMLDGKRPVFIDTIEASFFFPYHVIRFIEIPVGALEDHVATPATGSPPAGRGRARAGGSGNGHSTGADAPAESRLPVPVVGDAGAAADAGGDVELEIDEGFLQRIRDI